MDLWLTPVTQKSQRTKDAITIPMDRMCLNFDHDTQAYITAADAVQKAVADKVNAAKHDASKAVGNTADRYSPASFWTVMVAFGVTNVGFAML